MYLVLRVKHEASLEGKEKQMKTLIAEDDFTSRTILQKYLKDYGTLHVAANGTEAVEAVRLALDDEKPYDLVCLDIMMPEMDGHTALKEIRSMEKAKGIISSKGAKIVMTTALDDLKNVTAAYDKLCDVYLTKPIKKATLLQELQKLELIT